MIWKKILAVSPLISVALLIAFTQIYLVSPWISATRANNNGSNSTTQQLQMLGYTYNRDLIQLSVTLLNGADKPLTITQVYYDDVELTEGVVGSPNDSTMMGSAGSSSSNITSNDLIFPASGSWNMDTYGPSTPTIQAKGIVALYLGIPSTEPGTVHALKLVTEQESYVFSLAFQGD